MPKFGAASMAQRATCHPDLRRLADAVVAHVDCKFLEGRRTKEQQALNVAKGVSWTMESKHIPDPNDPEQLSDAMDLAFWPIDWGIEGTPEQKEAAIRKHYWFAGIVLGTAWQLGIAIRWGGDWDSDQNLAEERRKDLVHFERVAA